MMWLVVDSLTDSMSGDHFSSHFYVFTKRVTCHVTKRFDETMMETIKWFQLLCHTTVKYVIYDCRYTTRRVEAVGACGRVTNGLL